MTAFYIYTPNAVAIGSLAVIADDANHTWDVKLKNPDATTWTTVGNWHWSAWMDIATLTAVATVHFFGSNNGYYGYYATTRDDGDGVIGPGATPAEWEALGFTPGDLMAHSSAGLFDDFTNAVGDPANPGDAYGPDTAASTGPGEEDVGPPM